MTVIRRELPRSLARALPGFRLVSQVKLEVSPIVALYIRCTNCPIPSGCFPLI